MDVALFTTEEPLYLPRYLHPVLAVHADEIDGVYLVQFSRSRMAEARAQFRAYGPTASARFGARYARERLLDALPGDLGRRLTDRHHSVTSLAREYDVPVHVVPDVTDPTFVERVDGRDPDLLLSILCGQKLGGDLLSIPDEGAINVHGSLLPKYRGRATAFWPLYYGDDEHGVTAHYMTDRFDAGDIVRQRSFEVDADDTVDELFRKTAATGAAMVVELLSEFPDATLSTRPNPTTRDDYHALPSPEQRRAFRRRGNRFY